jgi:predicted  nucleic acid-binding Zn-ribbon protein
MRFWVYRHDRLEGPFERDKFSGIEDFNAETLVCPEGPPGSYPRTWIRAGMVPELAPCLLAPRTEEESEPARWGPLLPPEPNLGDVAALNSLRHKMLTLSNALHQMRGEITQNAGSIEKIREEISGNEGSSLEHRARLKKAEDRLDGLDALKPVLSRIEARFQEARELACGFGSLSSRLEAQAERLEAFEKALARLEALSGRLAEVERGLSRCREDSERSLFTAASELRTELFKSLSAQAEALRAEIPRAPAKPREKEAPGPDKAEKGLEAAEDSLLEEGGLESVDLFADEEEKPPA